MMVSFTTAYMHYLTMMSQWYGSLVIAQILHVAKEKNKIKSYMYIMVFNLIYVWKKLPQIYINSSTHSRATVYITMTS